jgi:hypothetical protein
MAGWIQRPGVERSFDFFVRSEHLAKAAQAMEKAIPGLSVVDGLLRKRLVIRDSKQTVANLIRPVQSPECQIFDNASRLRIGGEICFVPSLEMALAIKFAAMNSIYRPGVDQMLDAYEFALIVKHQTRVDEAKLRQLVSPLFRGAAKSVCQKIKQSGAHIAPVV